MVSGRQPELGAGPSLTPSDESGARPLPPEEPWAREWQHRSEDSRSMLGRHGVTVATDWFPIRRAMFGPPVPTHVGDAVATLRIPSPSNVAPGNAIRVVGRLIAASVPSLRWALQGSNLRPSDYESAALTG